MELVSLSDTPVPIVEKVTARTFALALVDVTQKGPDLIFKEQVCRLDTQIEISVVQMTPSKISSRPCPVGCARHLCTERPMAKSNWTSTNGRLCTAPNSKTSIKTSYPQNQMTPEFSMAMKTATQV